MKSRRFGVERIFSGMRHSISILIGAGLVLGLFVGCGPMQVTTKAGEEQVEGREIAPRSTVKEAERWVDIRRPERERRDMVFTGLGGIQGLTACDVGAGNGYFTLELARLVYPGGRAIAVDILQPMLDQLAARELEARRLGDQMVPIERVLGKADGVNLPDGTCDLVLVGHAFNEFARPRAMLASIAKVMTVNGRLVIVEYRSEDRAGGGDARRAMDKNQLHREVTEAGFKLVGQIDSLPTQHALFYARSDSPRTTMPLRPWRPRGVAPVEVFDPDEEDE